MPDETAPKLSSGGYRPPNDAAPEPRARGVRQVWERIPPGLRLVIPTALLLATVIVGFYVWMKPPRDDWSKLPSRFGITEALVSPGLTVSSQLNAPTTTPPVGYAAQICHG